MCITLNVCTWEEENSQINNLRPHFKKLETGAHIKANIHRRKKIIKIKAENNEGEKR